MPERHLCANNCGNHTSAGCELCPECLMTAIVNCVPVAEDDEDDERSEEEWEGFCDQCGGLIQVLDGYVNSIHGRRVCENIDCVINELVHVVAEYHKLHETP